jgi:hypothetical protein
MVELGDGTPFDQPIWADAVEAELTEWRRNRFSLFGEELELRRLSQDEALQQAPDLFGVVGCLDNDEQLIWSFPDHR